MKNNSIGKQLKNLRLSQKLTQQTVADAVKIKRSTISNYEIGRRTPSLNDLRTLATFYGVGLDYFGVTPPDEITELIARARKLFNNPDLSETQKDLLYKDLSKLYFKIK
ncbi:hypothetical protein [Butyrivibrio virus Bo-Finn]|jgi:transcriptional regulator with XRE-family HTH domain|nr:hypothetical protein [Butyrivibrio virus Arian]QHJ73687.1 hypothetical protein [Butyrivibrio virus Bo-Finn]